MKKKELIAITSLTLLFSFIILIKIIIKENNDALAKNPITTTAVIKNIYRGAKGHTYVKYEYVVDGRHYFGDRFYTPHKEQIEIGDSCFVIYDKLNHKNNKLVRDKDGLIKVKTDYRNLGN